MDDKKKTFSCNECPEVFESGQCLKVHQNSVHSKRKCLTCKISEFAISLIYH